MFALGPVSDHVVAHERSSSNLSAPPSLTRHHADCVPCFPVDAQYFLELFKQCVQLTEWWEEQLHGKWHSSEFDARKNAPEAPGGDEGMTPPTDSSSAELRELAAKVARPAKP